MGLLGFGLIMGIATTANSIASKTFFGQASNIATKTSIQSSTKSSFSTTKPSYTNSLLSSSISSTLSSITPANTIIIQSNAIEESSKEFPKVESKETQSQPKSEPNKEQKIETKVESQSFLEEEIVEQKINVTYSPIIEPEPKPQPEYYYQEPSKPTYQAPRPQPQPEPIRSNPVIESQPEPFTPIVPIVPAVVDNSKYTNPNCDYSKALEMLRMVNQHRANNGVGELSLAGDLNGVSCAHVKWMNATGNFSHTGVDGTDPFQRCERAGTECNAENVAFNSTADLTALFNQFKASPGHNANMLEPSYSVMGVGFENIYVGQLFR